MTECTRCGWTGPAGVPTCPRCGQPFAPPPPTARPTLILRLEATDLPAEQWEITDATLGIGRMDDSDITIPHKSVSRKHARILPTPTGFEIEDLGSTNGTYLNDQPISDRTPLADNDLLMIGDVPARVVLRRAAAPVGSPVVPEPRWPQPHPLPSPPPPERPSAAGPSTVYYDLDEALAEPQPPPPSSTTDVPTAWDVKPARPIEVQEVEHPTLVGAEVPAIEPAPPPPLPPPPPPPPRHEFCSV
jgi:predicted component of type VI protein secretion system